MTSIRIFENNAKSFPASFHGAFSPAEVRSGEVIRAALLLPQSKTRILAQVWRISPFGVELVVAKEYTDALSSDFQVELTLGRQKILYHGVTVGSFEHDAESVRVGLRLQVTDDLGAPAENRRQSGRWNCSPLFYPTGCAVNPARFNDVVHFRVKDIGPEGMLILTSLRNKYLTPGVLLDCTLMCPAIGSISLSLKVLRSRVIEEQGTSFQALGVRYNSISPAALNMLGQYVLQFGQDADGTPTIKQLKEAGFGLGAASKAVEYGYVRTEQDYQDVLALRLTAYKQVNKINQDATPADVADIYDSRARILVGRYRGKIVCSLRLIFPSAGDSLEHEEFIELPKNFPPKALMIESSRACTHPDFRGDDLLLGLMRHAAMTTAQADRRYTLISATAKLKHVYEQVGFVSTDIWFKNKTLNNTEHVVLLSDMRKILTGASLNPITWNFMARDLLEHVTQTQHFDATWLERSRMAAFRLLRPLAKLYMERALRPRRRPPAKGPSHHA